MNNVVPSHKQNNPVSVPQDDEIDVSIVIVSWNVKDMLRDCLHSISEHTHQYSYEIWVVDNNSNDGTVDMIKAEFPEVHLIANDFNAGFSEANNQAFKHCRGKYTAPLNPDTRLLNNAFDQMISFLERFPEYGAAGPKLLGIDGKPQAPCARHFPTLRNDIMKIFSSRRWIETYDFDQESDVEAVSGACLTIKREALQDVLFPTGYFMFGEDLELCWNIRKAGFKIRYIDSSEVLHYQGASSKQTTGISREAAFSRYLLRKRTDGLGASILLRVIIGLEMLIRIPKGMIISLSEENHTDGTTYLGEHLSVLKWVIGLGR